MAYPDNPEFIDFVDERTSPAEIEGEEHSISPGVYTYSLNEVPDTEYSISCTGDVNGSYTVSFTNTAPGSGCVYVNPLNGNALHCATDASDSLTWSYWGRGTANNKRMLEQYREPIEDVHKVARQFWVSATSPSSQGVKIAKGNVEIGGKLVEYNGGVQSFSSVTFENTGFFKAVRLGLNSSGSLAYSEGVEAASRILCGDPPSMPESKTLAIIFLQDGVDISEEAIVNTLIEVPYHSGDPDSDGVGDVAKYQYNTGVVSGDAVCLVSPNTVGKADADEDSKVPAIGFVEQILDETTCTVKSSGTFSFSGKSTTYDALAFGQQVYLSTVAGRIAQTRNQVPDEWDQPLGIALSSTKIQITIGAANKNKAGGGGDEPGPEGGKYKYLSGVAEGEFVYLKSDGETVDEARADSSGTMPAIGVVDELIDASWCIVKNNYQWAISEHGGITPGGLVAGSAGDVFHISVTAEGEVQTSQSINPDHYSQMACKQIDESGSQFLICCGPALKPEPVDPDDGYDYNCASDVGVGDAVYLDTTGVARKSDATDGSKCNPKGIVKAVNAANSRCNIVCPPNVFDPTTNYSGGDYFLNPAESGGYALRSNILFSPGHWLVRIGWGRGASLGGIQVDIKNYGMFGDPGEDDGGDSDPKPGRETGCYTAGSNVTPGTWAELMPSPSAVQATSADWGTGTHVLGPVLSTEYNPSLCKWVWKVLTRGLHGSGYSPGVRYFCTSAGAIAAKVAFGKYIKLAGIGQEDGQLLVCPGPVDYLDPDIGDPIPVTGFVEILDPAPVHGQSDKIRDWDDSSSGSPRSSNWVSRPVLCELPTVIKAIHFLGTSTGIGLGSYSLLDVCRLSDGASLLSTPAKIVATGDGTRGNTLSQDTTYGISAGHIAAVIDESKLPVAAGDAIYWKVTIDDGSGFTTAPYEFGIVLSKYGVMS
ncbi:MAG: hypothetical protein JW941_09340 [Candidatus Coatesbacteria bacterium]|nr:hypothetical protein [Candidatus Coatesbacteria bacterium]